MYEDEKTDVEEYGMAAIGTLIKLLNEVFLFLNTSCETFFDDKSRRQLSMLQRQSIALSKHLISKIQNYFIAL